MQETRFHIKDLKELEHFVKKILLPLTQSFKVIAFYGQMGTGKTTMINLLLKALGIPVSGSSPTFSIINEYEIKTTPVYHMDCYRMENEMEALDLGLEDYLDQDCLFLIEWPERIESILPEHVIIKIQAQEETSRIIDISLPEPYSP